MGKKLHFFIQACRPKTLAASIGPVLVGLALAGTASITHRPIVAVAALLCALLLQIGANLTNDYYDHKNKVDGADRLGPQRATASGALAPREVKRGFYACFLAALIVGLYLANVGGLPIIIIGVMSVVFAYLYTGGPMPLSYKGLGELLALVFFGPVAVWGTWFLMTNSFDPLPVIVGFGPGCIAASIMAINNMRDQKSDKASGKVTLAVLLGEKTSRVLPILGIAAASLLPIYIANRLHNWPILLACFMWVFFLPTWRRITNGPIDQKQNISLASTGKFLFAYCAVMSVSLLLSGSLK